MNDAKTNRRVTFLESVEVHDESSSILGAVEENKKKIKHSIEDPILKEFFRKAYNYSRFLKPFVKYCLGLDDDPRSDGVRILSTPVIDNTYMYTLFNSDTFSDFQRNHSRYFSANGMANYYEIVGCIMVTRVIMKPETVAANKVYIKRFPQYLRDVFIAFRDTFETHIDFDDK